MISSLEALVPWFSSGFLCRVVRDSLNNSKDQWSDLSIILQLLKISCDMFVHIGLNKSGEIEFQKRLDVLKIFARVDVGVDFRVFACAVFLYACV